jgi:hypothetical protein
MTRQCSRPEALRDAPAGFSPAGSIVIVAIFVLALLLPNRRRSPA